MRCRLCSSHDVWSECERDRPDAHGSLLDFFCRSCTFALYEVEALNDRIIARVPKIAPHLKRAA